MSILRTARHTPLRQETSRRQQGRSWPRVVWCIHDATSGHRRQLEGLARALQEQQNAAVYWLPYRSGAADLPRPELILVCGRRTHWAGLKARWWHGGKLVALMNPGVLRPLFDACIVPEHDGLEMSRRNIVTRGPLNPLRPATRVDPSRGLILIGGPSRHFHWDAEQVVEQIQRLRCNLPDVNWQIATSRRTPNDFVPMLSTLQDDRCHVLPAAETSSADLRAQYDQCGIIWVTADSAAMLYEALSSGAAVGVLDLQARKPNRLQAGLDKLIADGHVTELVTLEHSKSMPPPRPPLRESQRAAAALRARFIVWSHQGHCSTRGK
ncbi:MAG TPA: hypothetical protein DCP75_01530 [Haliea salexigens]|uniref:Nucleoside-diphosphate sugar epimerase n=1 Tax=Haliea salexigens TaxID=287487 RepID=A0A3C1KJ53_9GAMM|nr:hypothetical protein [Haliea sp.]HAN26414.1 hypothetical protein [Haliea salexigens]